MASSRPERSLRTAAPDRSAPGAGRSAASIGRHRNSRIPLPLLAGAVIGTGFLVLPLVGLLVRAPYRTLLDLVLNDTSRTALRLSLVCSLSATALCVLFGVPVAWVLQRTTLPGRRLLHAVTTLPVVLPPVVGGVALLLAFGRQGILGQGLDAIGIRLAFSTTGVIVAETFVAMPFLVLAVSGALEAADGRLEEAARTLGASPWTIFWRVTIPVIRPSLIAGAILSWARALGEFGATITFAGNFRGETQTLPLAVYDALQADPADAIALSLMLMLLSLATLVALRNRWVRAL